MDLILDILSWVLIAGGAIFSVIGAIGLLRFPDFYTRLHAAGITDTMGAWMLLVGFMLQADHWLVIVKLALILVFLFFTSPTSSFSLAHAALSSGVDPMLDADLRGDADKIQQTGEKSS